MNKKPHITFLKNKWFCKDEYDLIVGIGLNPALAYRDYIYWKNYKFH